MRPRICPKSFLVKWGFSQLDDEVPRMPAEAPADLEEPLLEARQRPTLDGERYDQPGQEIAEMVP